MKEGFIQIGCVKTDDPIRLKYEIDWAAKEGLEIEKVSYGLLFYKSTTKKS